MKKLLAVGLITALFASLGCSDQPTKSTPGGPGATGSTNRGTGIGSRDTGTGVRDTGVRDNGTADRSKDTFTIKVPGETTLKQGEKKEITITVDREKEFKQDVTLKLTTSDTKGIIITPSTETVKASDASAQAKFTVEATKDAAVAEHVITVTGTPAQGAHTSASFKINVKGS